MRIESFVLGDWQTNCWLVWVDSPDQSPPKAWIIDPGQVPLPVIARARELGLAVEAVLLTHAHVDHIAGVDQVRTALGVPELLCHVAEQEWLGDALLNLSALAGMKVRTLPATRLLNGGETLPLGSSQWRVLHTPGHSPGGVTFVCDAERIAIVGDTLFAGSMGRIDLPGADPEAMRHSLFEILLKLPDDYRVLNGHGPQTTIGRERRSNPFLRHGGDDWGEML